MAYDDLDRPPLRAGALDRALGPDGWSVQVHPTISSTQGEVVARAREGAAGGLVVVAEAQTAGRGRLDRAWVSPPRAGLTLSVLLRPRLAPADLGWVPLLAGLCVARVLREQVGVDAVLKWPNDVLVGGRKVAGLLAEAVPGPAGSATAVVVGVGLNVTTRADELPAGVAATSLALETDAAADRDTLLRALLRELAAVLGAPADPGPVDLAAGRAAYRALCSTTGREVTVALPDGTQVAGTAQEVDDSGRLVVGGVPHAAGDVVHAHLA